jgi:hypothetical protein
MNLDQIQLRYVEFRANRSRSHPYGESRTIACELMGQDGTGSGIIGMIGTNEVLEPKLRVSGSVIVKFITVEKAV